MPKLTDILSNLDQVFTNFGNKSSSVLGNLNQTLQSISKGLQAPVFNPNAPQGAYGTFQQPGIFASTFAHFLGQGTPKDPLKGLSGLAGELGFKGISDKLATVSLIPQAMAGDPEAVVALAKKAIDQVKESFGHAQQGVGELGKSFGSEKIEDVGSHFFKAQEHFAQMVPVIGNILALLPKAGEEVFNAIGKLRRFNEQLLESDFRFAEFSASMSRVQIEQEIREMELSRERGERRAGSADLAAKAKFNLDSSIAPYEDFFARFRDINAAAMSNFVATNIQALEMLSGGKGVLADALHNFLDWLSDEAGGEALDQIHEDQLNDWFEHHNLAIRFQNRFTSGRAQP